MKNSNKLEKFFEGLLWQSRLIVIVAVICSILASITLFLIGSYSIIHSIGQMFPLNENISHYENLIIGIIKSVDLYLIAIVLLLFGFGIYELFISKIDIARLHDEIKILDIKSLDELKNKILKVIIMVLIVSFFQGVLSMKFTTHVEMLYFVLGIVGVAVAAALIWHREKDDEGH